MTDRPVATVYFNSACPVCRTGIEWQQGQASSCEIEWIDVHGTPEAVADVGAELDDVRERLHVRDAEGRILVGADAVAFVMGSSPGQRGLGTTIDAAGDTAGDAMGLRPLPGLRVCHPERGRSPGRDLPSILPVGAAGSKKEEAGPSHAFGMTSAGSI